MPMPDAPAAERPASGMFSSLRVPNYRRYASGQVVSLVGTWMQRVAQDWLVLELSHGSPVALGIAAALQFGPTLGLSLWGGVLADRYDKRRLLIGVQTGLGLCALSLGLLDVGGVVALWQVYLLCFTLGCFSAIDTPVRQSFAVEMVGRRQLTNAVALNSVTFNVARIIGPAVAGLMITATGTGWVFLANAISFIAVLGGLLRIRPELLYPAERLPRQPGQLREGLRYVRGRRDLTLIMTLVFCVSTFGLNFFMTLAVLARNVFDRGAESYGLLTTMMAVGSVCGATLAARRAGPPRLRLVLLAATAFGVSACMVALMPTYLTTALMLVPTGAAALTFTTAANSTVQLSVAPTMRGRVMGLYMVLFLGGTPLAGPVLGVIADQYGGRAPILFGGLLSLLCTVTIAVLLARSRTPAREVTAPAGEPGFGGDQGEGKYGKPCLTSSRGLTSRSRFVVGAARQFAEGTGPRHHP